MKVNFDTYVGVQNLTKKYDILNTREYIEAINAISIDKGDGPVFNADDIASIGTGTDWQDEIFRSANVQNHSLSFNGGTDNVSYYISCNYFNQQGLVENSGMKKYTLKTNLVSNINDRFSINLNLNSSLVSDEAAVEGLTHNENGGVIYSAVFYDPTWPIKDENGNYIQSTDLLLPNPVTIYKGIENDVQTIRMFGNIALNYQITDELSTKLNFGSDLQNARRDIYNSRITFQGKANNGLAFINSLNRSNILAEYTLSYLKTISENHVITALAGVTYQDFIDKTYSSGISNFPTDILSTNNLAFGNADQAFVNSQKEGYTLLSYLGRINYSIFNKFLLTGSFRVDGSSRFGENNKFGYFPSFAFAWKLHEENFIPELLSELKLRTSWGLTGNQEIENYNSLSTYTSVGSAVFNGQQQTAAGPSRLANPDLKWETTEQYNIGIDVGFFDGRLSGSVDYFIKNTRDILINLPLPLSSGYDDKLTNVGKMRNNGIETIINSKNIAGRDFEWNTILNFSAIKNEAVDISEDLTMILMGNAPEAAGNSTIVKPGLPINSYYGFMITGIFQTQEEVDNSAQPNSKPGFPIFDDTNGDGTINSNDKVVLGDPFPDFTFGISNTFKYKNFGLDIIFNGQYGNELLNATAIGLMYPSNFRRNRSREQINDRWTTQNPDAKWPSQTDPSSYGGGRVNNLVVEDASYIRLQSLQLSYILPTKNIDFINMVRINITGQNLFTITNYTGFNPDANVYGRNNYQIGFMEYPVAKIWTVGLNVIF